MRILIVEDQGLVRSGMRTMIRLVEPECEVLEASHFVQAMELLERAQIDVAFLDIDLRAESGGLDILRRVRDAGLKTRVIMLSASDERDVVLSCIAAGASGYITKAMGDESVFARALSVVLHEGVFLPSSVIGEEATPEWASELNIPREPLDELGLSPRERDVLYLLCQGLPNKVIANQMGISEGTVRKNYVPELLRAFKVARRTELIIEVARRGIRLARPLSLESHGSGR